MKRFFTMIVAACAFFAASAQNPMVTLSHDGELTFFTNLSCLEDALVAAQDGDTVYLSEGVFTSAKTYLNINKRINIIGNGYGSQILCGLKISMVNNPYVEGQSFNVDGISLNELSFDTGTGIKETNDAQRNNLRFVNLTNSRINKISYAGLGGKDLSISSCYIDVFHPYGVSNNNTLITNSKINKIISQLADSKGATITLKNCNVWGSYYLPTTVVSSIIACSINDDGSVSSKFAGSDGKINLINSLFSSTSAFPTNYAIVTSTCYFEESDDFYNEVLDTKIDLVEKGYFGQDGKTVVGIHGGESPFSENPSVPTVDTANSSVEYDSAANKLKVNITVKAD